MLCHSPLSPSAPWICEACGFKISSRQAAAVQGALGSLLEAVDLSNPREVQTFLLKQRALCPSNHVAVDLKCSLIWSLGHSPGFTWTRKFLCIYSIDSLKNCRRKRAPNFIETQPLGQRWRRNHYSSHFVSISLKNITKVNNFTILSSPVWKKVVEDIWYCSLFCLVVLQNLIIKRSL